MATAPSQDVERVLVTGASGYIATHIVKQLQEAGYKVRGTVRSLSNPKKVDPIKALCLNAAHELELVEADLNKDDGWKDAVQGCSHVIHTASPFPAKNPKHEDEVIKPAVEGTIRVLQACVNTGGVVRVVVTSSCAAVTDMLEKPGTGPITEEQWRNLDSPLNDSYGKSKAMAERAAWQFVENLPAESKLELATINPSLVLGPVLCGSPGTSVEVIRRIVERDPFLVPKMNFPVCDVRDVAKAHLAAMSLPEAAGHRHLISAGNLWMLEMSEILDAEFRDKGYKTSKHAAPNVVLRFLGLFDSSIKYVAQLLDCVAVFSDRRLREVLGITPYDAKDTLIDMAYSCIDQGLIERKKGYYNPRAQEEDASQ